ncbi:MAG: Holliday junction resolvase RuvX [Planctomycetaceae bacterium]|nr:Holliday junction resolvase RuvX [Planctomycetaceae bacterium]
MSEAAEERFPVEPAAANDGVDKAATPDVPSTGRLLGVDPGARRIGFAVCDDRQVIASPLENYTRWNPEADARFLRTLVEEYRVVGIVIGLPVHMSGDEGGQAAEARALGAWVSQITSLPVAFWDERYTTSLADEYLRSAGLSRDRRKALRDKIAAQVILQSFIDSPNRNQAPPSLHG